MTRFIVFALLAAAAAPGASVYPQRPNDRQAVYLTRDSFPVHADGMADDAPALQQAIDKVQEASRSGIVFVPEGRYALRRTVNLWNGIRLIGYGANRPVFVLPAGTPGFQEGEGKYVIHFRENRPRDGSPLPDANRDTFTSGMINIDMEIGDGNPAAIAVRFHVAQLSVLQHMDFHIGGGRAAIEEIGNEISDCRFFGGDYAIRTGWTSAAWQSLLLDSEFEGQRIASIETHEAGLTAVRCHFRNAPRGIVVPDRFYEVAFDQIYLKDILFEDITAAAVTVANYFDPRDQLNFENVQARNVARFIEIHDTIGSTGGGTGFPKSGVIVPGDTPLNLIRNFTAGFYIDDKTRERRMEVDRVSVDRMDPLPQKDYRELPPMSAWLNIVEFGAKGDGTTDDTEIFRQAIATHEAIYVPMGRYRLTDALQLRPDTALIGLHCGRTSFVLAPRTPGFDDPGNLKAMIVAPQGGAAMISGIGLSAGANRGSIALKWMSGARSLVNDVTLAGAGGGGATAGGYAQAYGIWVTGGGGVFKNIWGNNSGQNGFYVSDTSTPGRIYEMSVEHHREVEVRLKNVSNWNFYALQDEEDKPDAAAVILDNSRNVTFANAFFYRVRALNTPYPYAVRLQNSGSILFRGLHVFSLAVFPFDNAVYQVDSKRYWPDREAAWVRIP